MILENTSYHSAVATNDRVQFETAVTVKDLYHTAQIIKQDVKDGYLVVVFRGQEATAKRKTTVLIQCTSYQEAYAKLNNVLKVAANGLSLCKTYIEGGKPRAKATPRKSTPETLPKRPLSKPTLERVISLGHKVTTPYLLTIKAREYLVNTFQTAQSEFYLVVTHGKKLKPTAGTKPLVFKRFDSLGTLVDFDERMQAAYMRGEKIKPVTLKTVYKSGKTYTDHYVNLQEAIDKNMGTLKAGELYGTPRNCYKINFKPKSPEALAGALTKAVYNMSTIGEPQRRYYVAK